MTELKPQGSERVLRIHLWMRMDMSIDIRMDMFEPYACV